MVAGVTAQPTGEMGETRAGGGVEMPQIRCGTRGQGSTASHQRAVAS